MLWVAGLVLAYVMMATSKALWGNPLTVFGLAFVGGCVWLLGAFVLKVIGMSLS